MTTENSAPIDPNLAVPQEDAPNAADAAAPVDPQINPRNIVMAEVVERRKAELDAEMGADAPVPDQDDVPMEGADIQTDAAAPAMTDEGVPPAQTPEPVAAAPGAPEIDPNAEYSFVVNGQTVRLKGSQLVAKVQKIEAADSYLQVATELLNVAKERTHAGPPAKADAPPAPTSVLDGKSAAEIANDLQFGTPEQAAKVVEALMGLRTANVVTTEGLEQFAARQLPAAVSDEIAFQSAVQFLNAEYGDLLKDPILKDTFLFQDEKLRRAGDQRSYVERFKAIGDQIRVAANRPKPGTTKPTQAPAVRTIEQRRDVKRQMPMAPKLASVRMDGDGQPTLTPEQARQKGIEAMRQRTRGQRQAPQR